jgi:hypothetical protein
LQHHYSTYQRSPTRYDGYPALDSIHEVLPVESVTVSHSLEVKKIEVVAQRNARP